MAAIEHVVGNAVKYTPDGGTIRIVGRNVKDKAVDIIIQDTGIGIPLDEQRHIFEQFYTLGEIEHHSTSKSAFQGGAWAWVWRFLKELWRRITAVSGWKVKTVVLKCCRAAPSTCCYLCNPTMRRLLSSDACM